MKRRLDQAIGTVPLAIAVALLAMPFSACSPKRDGHAKVISQRDIGRPTRAGVRRVVPSHWDTVYTFGTGGPQFGRDIAIAPATIYYINARADSVVAVDWKMRLRWRVPLRTAGDVQPPFPIELVAARDGGVWVLNGKTGGIKRVRATGAAKPFRPPGTAHVQGIASIGADTLATLSDADTLPLSLIGPGGHIMRQISSPWSFYSKLAPLSRAADLSADERGNWAIGFFFGDGWAVWDTLGRVHTGVFVEATEFPDLLQFEGPSGVTTEVPRSVRSAISVALDGSKLYVLFGGATRDHNRLVDEYDVSTSEYKLTYIVPERAGRVIAMVGHVYAISESRPLRILELRTGTPALGAE